MSVKNTDKGGGLRKTTERIKTEAAAKSIIALENRATNFLKKIDGVAKGGENASKLTGKTRIIYDDLIKAGFKTSDEGVAIVFKNSDNAVVAKISDDALHIKIPDSHGTGGWATQSNSVNAINALNKVNEGAPLYRIGTLNRSAAAEAQYWSLENPLDIKNIKDFATKYGIPESNLETGQFFVEIAKPKSGMPRISREAPAFGNNPGGSIEIVVPPSGVRLESFHTIKF